MPAVSVLVPYRDSAATIEEALESVLAQRGVALEILAVDDGSSDDGPARVARMASRDRRVVPLEARGVGIAPALTEALSRARAPLVARMDSDDVSLPDRLARQLEALAAEPGLAAVGTRVEGFPDAALGDGLRRYIAWQNAIVTAAEHAREIFVECTSSCKIGAHAMIGFQSPSVAGRAALHDGRRQPAGGARLQRRGPAPARFRAPSASPRSSRCTGCCTARA